MAGLGGPADAIRDTAILVPTIGAAGELRQTLEDLVLVERWAPASVDRDTLGLSWLVETPPSGRGADTGGAPRAFVLPHLVTRSGLYELLRTRLPEPVALASGIERDVIMERAAAASAAAGARPPFVVRPALLAEMLGFLDVLGRERRSIEDFERLVGEPLASGAAIDRGAKRLLQQTTFLAAAFRTYEAMLAASDVLDEHGLRQRLLTAPAARPLRHLVVTVPDRSASAHGLWPADYDLLTRIAGLESMTIVASEAMLATGYMTRLLDTLPEIEVIALGGQGSVTPALAVPEPDGSRCFLSRDREDELADVASRVRARPPSPGARAAVVYQRPLPYLALARQVFGASGVSWQALDALPLASEPYAAAVDLVLTYVTTACSRTAGIALLRAPQFRLGGEGPLPGAAIAAADRELADAFYLGGRDRLRELNARWIEEATSGDQAVAPRSRADHARGRRRRALPAVAALVDAADRLAALDEAAPPSRQLAVLAAFLRAHDREPDDADLRPRHVRARSAIFGLLGDLGRAFVRHGDQPRPFADLAALVRGLIEEHTFNPRVGPGIVQLVDALAAPYGRYQDATLVGLTETDWPEPSARSIFYPGRLLRELGWPADADRRTAARAAFDDLLQLPLRTIALSTILLEDDAMVRPSAFLEDLERASPTTSVTLHAGISRVSLALRPVDAALEPMRQEWARIRERPAREELGDVGPLPAAAYPVTAIDRYRECPFKYFAAQVLRLDEEREDRPGLTPLERGAFVHDVFHAFFARWSAAGRGTIGLAELEAARHLFTEVVDERLERLPDSERAIERARLVGSAAGSGVGERVFRFEAGRPLPIVERLLEVSLSGDRVIRSAGGERTIRLRGTADRIDLLADGTLRLIDYKTGKASAAKRAMQVPVYALCAEQHLYGHAGRTWRVTEGGYLAFGREEPYAPVLTAENRDAVLAGAASALLDTVDAIERGSFPVDPEEPHLCTFCGFAAVCRKDYVEDS